MGGRGSSSGISDIQDDTQESSETTEEGTTKETTTKVTTTKETTTKKKIPTEYISAVRTAQSYSDNMYMSKQGIYDQLTSDYGGKFSKEAAKYAIEHIDADWNYNALQTAKTYQDQMAMSPAAIHDQLTSSYGGKFTKKQADYAIAHLDD